MPATCNTRGILKTSQNRVRTSGALQGSAMWESVIGLKNEERGANAEVEAMLNAPKRGFHGEGKKKRQAAAAEAMKATGNFDTGVTDYDSLLSLAKSQGALGEAVNRGGQEAAEVVEDMKHSSDDDSLLRLASEDEKEEEEERRRRKRRKKQSRDRKRDDCRDDEKEERRRRRRRRDHHSRRHRDRDGSDSSREEERRRRRHRRD
eukprot:jgi/Picre1/33111/NNA_008437.t1